MAYLTMIKILGGIVGFVMLFKLGSYFFTYTFFKKLDKFLKKDLSVDDVKYIANEINKYKLGRNSYNWDILAEAVVKINRLEIDQEVIDKVNDIADKKGLDVEKVLEYNNEGE